MAIIYCDMDGVLADFKTLRSETRTIKLGDKGKTATGKDAGVVELEPQARPI